MNQTNGFTKVATLLVILVVGVVLLGVFSSSFRRSVGLEKHPAYGRWNEVMMTHQKHRKSYAETSLMVFPMITSVMPGTVLALIEYRALRKTIPVVRKLGGTEYDDIIERIVDDCVKSWDVAKRGPPNEVQKKALLARVEEIEGIFGPSSKDEVISIRRIVLADVGFRLVDRKGTGDEEADLPLKLAVTLAVLQSP